MKKHLILFLLLLSILCMFISCGEKEKNDSLEEKDIWVSYQGERIEERLNITVLNEISTINLDLGFSSSEGVTLSFYESKDSQSALSGNVSLEVGENHFYLKAENQNTFNWYDIVVKRNASFRVTWTFGNGDPSQTEMVDEGTILTCKTPTRAGYSLVGFEIEGNMYNNTPITSNVTLQAKWQKNNDSTSSSIKIFDWNVLASEYGSGSKATSSISIANHTTTRKDILLKNIAVIDADILTFQEYRVDWSTNTKDEIEAMGYTSYIPNVSGVGTAIFYKAERFTQLDSGYSTRYAYKVLMDKKEGDILIIFSVQSEPMSAYGESYRIETAELYLQKLVELQTQYYDAGSLIVGDYNTLNPNLLNDQYRAMLTKVYPAVSANEFGQSYLKYKEAGLEEIKNMNSCNVVCDATTMLAKSATTNDMTSEVKLIWDFAMGTNLYAKSYEVRQAVDEEGETITSSNDEMIMSDHRGFVFEIYLSSQHAN